MGSKQDRNSEVNVPDITRSNALIGAKYTSTVTENKLMAISLAYYEKDDKGRICTKIDSKKLMSILNIEHVGSVYERIKAAASRMTNYTMLIEDKKEKSFKFINIVNIAEFKNGYFTITYTPEMNEFIEDLKDNFTTMNVATLVKFRSNYSYRIYELLKTYLWKVNKNNDIVVFEIGIDALRLSIGCVDLNDDNVRSLLQSEHPDYEEIVRVAKNQKLKNFAQFKTNALDVAKKEINEKSDIFMDYETIRCGRGGKVVKIKFLIKRNREELQDGTNNVPETREIVVDDQVSVISEKNEDLLELIDELSDYIEEPLKTKQLKELLNEAHGDIDLVKQKYDLMKKQKGTVENLMGWLKSAIREDYEEENITLIDGDAAKGKAAKEVLEDYQKAKEDGSIFDTVWNSVCRSDDFEDFMDYIEASGMPIEMFKEFLTNEDKVMRFYDWRKKIKNIG